MLVPSGKIVVRYDAKPMFNSMIYEVEFPFGEVEDYASNFICVIILSQVDDKGYSVTLIG